MSTLIRAECSQYFEAFSLQMCIHAQRNDVKFISEYTEISQENTIKKTNVLSFHQLLRFIEKFLFVLRQISCHFFIPVYTSAVRVR